MPKRKRADKLAQDYELGSDAEDYFHYIVESLINGQRQQVKDLFNQMHKEDKDVFLNQWLDIREEHSKETHSICVKELIK